MASTNKKKFKTSATSKAAGDTVTSDAILLEPGTKDHILVTTVDSSANLSGQVDIELEMSPDGQNWCPAQVKTTTTTQGSTTEAIVGNEKAVDLAGDIRNKFARGRLEYNLSDGLDYSGNYPLQERARKDGSDFVHHMIAANKSFNYSGWYNSDVQPSSTYTPVLFRNGGIDDFENTNTIQLNNITEILSETKYAKFPSDSQVVYQADFPITDFEGTNWLVGLTKAGDPSHTGVYTNTDLVYVEIGDLTAGDYVRTEISDYYVISRVFVGNTQQNIGSHQAAFNQFRGYRSSQSNQTQSYTTWIHHPIFDSANPHSTSPEFRFRKWTSDRAFDLITYRAGWAGSYSSDITTSTSLQIRVIVPANANATQILQNLVIYQINDTSLDGGDSVGTKERILAMKHVQAPSAQGHTLLAAYNFGDVSGSSIADTVGSNTMTKTYSGSDTLEYSNLALSGPTIRRPAFYPKNTAYAATGLNAGFANTTSGLPDITNGFAILFSGVFRHLNNYPRIFSAYQSQYTYFEVEYNSYGNYIKVHFKDVFGSITGISYGSGTSVLIPAVSRSDTFLLVFPPKGATDNLFLNTKVYSIGPTVNLNTATTSDLSIQTENAGGISAFANATSFSPSTSMPTNIGYNNTGGSSTMGLFNGSFSDQEALDLLISCQAPHLKNFDTEVSNLSNATLASCYGKDVTSLTSPTTTYVDQNGSNDGTFASSEQVIDLNNQGQADKTTQNLCEANTLPFSSIFTTTSNLSISGWFKTTDTGTLFSNTEGAAITGMIMQVADSTMILTLNDGSTIETVTVNSDVNDGSWHHVCVVKPSGTTPTIKVYVDGTEVQSTTTGTLSNTHLRGNNGFTLLSDGQNNAINPNAASTDASKLQASLSNWSLHSEVLDEYAAKQLYSNGHVRNIKNLPSVDPLAIVAWWQLNDSANPEQDLSGNGNDLQYQDGDGNTLVSQQVLADGATLIQDTINGNGMTLSLTKNFDFESESWITDASGDAAFCLSFNGFEDQAEYFALWKCNQVKQDYNVNFLDGNWHNIVLSYRNTTEGSTVKFGPYTATGIGAAFNWNLSMDGIELNDQNSSIGVDYIGGLNSFLTHNNVNIGFPIYNRHLKYVGSTEENYLAHTQGGATNVYEDASGGVTQDNPYGFILQPPVSTDTPWTFQGLIDETSFHSQDFWTSSGGSDPTNFESEYPATIYGNTNGLTGTRGSTATTYTTGIPYPLNDPSAIGASPGDSQYINPNRYDAATNPGGGLEAWWRWGDTDQDCGENINDVKDKADGVPNHHLRAVSIDTQDLYLLNTAPDSTYLANQDATTTQGSAVTEFISVVMSNIVDTACNVKDLAQPILQYLRVKITGTGSVDLGKGKAETSIYFTKRRKK